LPMSEFHIEELSPYNENDWTLFNERSTGGSFFHTIKWKKIIEESLDYRSRYFLVYEGSDVKAICPFFESDIKLFKGLMLLPHSDYRHILVENVGDSRIVQAILDASREMARRRRLSFFEFSTLSETVYGHLKNSDSLPFAINGNMNLDLKRYTPEKIWTEVFSDRGAQRRYITRLQKDGYSIREASSIGDLSTFYQYYKMNLEDKVAGLYPFSYFEALWRTFNPGNLRITFLERGDDVMGGLLAFLYPERKTMYLRHIGLKDNISSRYRPPYNLLWDALECASDMGYDTLEVVHYRLKKKFGCVYENGYSMLFPVSPLFKTGYRAYLSVKKAGG
jgi:hypothetical protein